MTSILILLLCLTLLPVKPAAASWFFGDDTLVSIDGNNYSSEDFKHWWQFWKEEDTPFPETPEPYIDWLLLSQEGERMDLANAPGFKRQTRIFLQSRTLLMLKYDAVDSQVKVTEDEIKARYKEKYLPLWQVERLTFKDEAAALAAWQQLSTEQVTIAELEKRKVEEGGPHATNVDWLRPNRIDPGWVTIFQDMKVGEVVDPNKHNNGPNLYFLKDRKDEDAEGQEKMHDRIRKDIWREKENDLTKEMIDNLRDKYQVTVDEERLEALDINAPDETFTDAKIISSTKQDVTEKQFMAIIQKVKITSPAAAMAFSDPEKAVKLKHDTVDNIIAQAVTNWESLDRHYETKEPFKWEYEFNYNHRLGLAVEERVFVPEATVSDEEVKQQYKEHPERYTQPSIVKLYLIDETQGPIDKVWADVAAGEDFALVAKEQFGMDFKPQEVPENHLDPEVKPIVAKLADGETSQIFTAQGIRVVAHLVKRTPAAPLSFDRVKTSIKSELHKVKLNKLREAYLKQLKAQSKIEVHDGEWQDIRKELGGA